MRSTATWACLPLFGLFHPLLQQTEPPKGDAADATVQALRERLRSGPGPVRIVVFGDSLAAGWGPKDPMAEAYSAVFARALRARYPACDIEVIAAGGPGDSSEVGLIRLQDEVIRRSPDVVVIQFGGNDQRLGRDPRELTDDLIALVQRTRDALPKALCLIVTPPMNDPEPNTRFVRAAVFAAQAAGVLVADFDGALRAADRDFRGPFCWGAHPGAYSHLIMGRELLRAWDGLLGTPNPLSVRIGGYSRMLRAGESAPFEVSIRNVSETGLAAELEYGPALLARRREVDLKPGATVKTEEEVCLPEPTTSHRTRTFKLWALGRAVEAEASDLDTKWLSIAPVVTPDVAGEDLEAARLTWHAFGADSLVKGDWSWRGDEDLSARFAVALQPEHLTFVVDVTDDDISPASRTQHFSDGDSVELCLDLRPPADQGKPTYSPDVVLLLAKPGATLREEAQWEPLDALTPRLADVTVESTLKPRGYVLRVQLPRRSLERNGAGLTGIGFDVHVNDSDFGLGRERQMVWAGTEDNFLNPSALAALAEPGDDPPLYRASLR